MTEIDPTALIEFDKAKLSFKDNLRLVAQLVGEEQKVDNVLSEYQKRVENLQNRIGKSLEDIKVSVVELVRTDILRIGNPQVIYNQVLKDIGLALPSKVENQNEFYTYSHIELIDKYDADFLFIINEFYGNNKLPSDIEKLLSSLKANKNNQVHIVTPDIWWSYGPLGVNKLLDELPKYFLDNA